MKFAIIDIGSNSVRLMIWADGKTLYKKVITTRLGAKLSETGVLSEEAMERTLQAIASFHAEAVREGAEVFPFATAAVRSAKNGGVFCDHVRNATGLNVDVVSGTDEARLAVLGALGNSDGGIVDIGGASTEVCFRKGGETVFSVSMNLGAVKLFDLCGDDPEKLKPVIARELSALDGLKPCGTLYAVGGTASTLASVKAELSEYDGARLQNLALEKVWLEDTVRRLFSLTVAERKAIRGMDVQRADVIAGAAYLLSEIVKKLSVSKVVFSDRDNLEGYLAYRGLA